MRRHFEERGYVGVEIEVSQRFPLGPAAEWRRLREALRDSLATVLASGTRKAGRKKT